MINLTSFMANMCDVNLFDDKYWLAKKNGKSWAIYRRNNIDNATIGINWITSHGKLRKFITIDHFFLRV